MTTHDFQINFDDGDLRIANGDFVIGDSDQQHIRHVVQAQRGQFYESPTIGVGIVDEINSSITIQNLKNRIKTNLRLDNYETDAVFVDDEFRITIDAKRTK